MSRTILLVAAISNLVHGYQLAPGPCKLKILTDDYAHWHDLTEGFMYGFYKNPPNTVSDCEFCEKMGGSFGAIQKIVSTLYTDRTKWVNLNHFNSLGFFDKVRLMSGLFLQFWAFGFQVNYQWNNWLWRALIDSILKKFDSNYFAEIEMNFQKDWLNSTYLLISMPGESCEAIGTRFGLIARHLSGVSI